MLLNHPRFRISSCLGDTLTVFCRSGDGVAGIADQFRNLIDHGVIGCKHLANLVIGMIDGEAVGKVATANVAKAVLQADNIVHQ